MHLQPKILSALLLAGGCFFSAALRSRAADAPLGSDQVHYTMEGSGPSTLVLVHGWGGNTTVWREQLPALLPHARVLRVDLPGHGGSAAPERAYTLDHFARGVLAAMDHAGVDRAVLVGHSMGAAVICRVHAQAPRRVAALVSVDGMLRRPPLTREQMDGFLAAFRGPDCRAHAAKFIGSMFPHPGSATLRDEVCREVDRTPVHVMRGAMEAMFGPDSADWNPGTVEVPLLVINAASPHWTADDEAFARTLSPKCIYTVIEGPGHFLMLEAPEATNDALLAGLREFGLVTP